MESTEADNTEKRKHQRKQVRHLALVKIGSNLFGRGYTRDISLTGMCLESVSIFRLIKPARVNDILGLSISAQFAESQLTVNGTVVRIDSQKGETAVVVSDTTDNPLWESMCA
ncbi:MAG TPA: PilZ domain-containing protein [Desulfomonilia bacterium]